MGQRSIDRFSSLVKRVGVRSALVRLAKYPFDRKKRKKFERDGLSLVSPEERFNWIYRNRYWGDGETLSGSGSTLDHTLNLRGNLLELVRRFGIKRFLDAPCGDFAWMRHVLNDMDVTYIGADIVAPIISGLQAEFETDKVSFVHLDITRDRLPQADIMMCRDCLFHLCYMDIARALRNFIDSDIPYLLTTTHINKSGFKNRDIQTGEHRLIDLFAEPFCFPDHPLERISDWIKPKPEKEMCLWSREQVLVGTEEFRKVYLSS